MAALASFLAMGGYARFVWPAYGVAALVLLWMLGDSLAGYRRANRDLALLEQDRPRR